MTKEIDLRESQDSARAQEVQQGDVEEEQNPHDYLKDPPSRFPPVKPLYPKSRKVFQDVDGKFWVGFHVQDLPPRLHAELITLRDASVPRFYNEEFPYLCASMLPNALYGNFLSSFATISIVPLGNAYALSAPQLREWKLLEINLFNLCYLLLRHITTTLEFGCPIAPFKTGYRRTFPDSDAAYQAAHRARQAFALLFGMASYLIALAPNWGDIAWKGGLSIDWLKALESSPIADFGQKVPRVGTFIDLSRSSTELRRLPFLAKKNIPFWVFWGDGRTYKPTLEDEVDAHMARAMLKPTEEELDWSIGENPYDRAHQETQKQLADRAPPLIMSEDGSCCINYKSKADTGPSYGKPWTYCANAPVAQPDTSNASFDPWSTQLVPEYMLSRNTFDEESSNDQFNFTDEGGGGWDIGDADYGSQMADKPAEHSGDPKASAEASSEADERRNDPTADLPPVEPYDDLAQLQPGQVEKGSRQRPLEMPQEFWERQRQESDEKLAAMPPSQRKKYENERHRKFITKKSKVFYWVKTSWGRVRRLVRKKEYDNYMDNYADEQMRFSVWRNEWDICTEFAPDAEAPNACLESDPEVEKPHSTDAPDDIEPQNGDASKTVQARRSAMPSDEHLRAESGGNDSGQAAEYIISESDYCNMLEEGELPDELVLTERHFQDVLNERYSFRLDVPVREWKAVSIDEMLFYRYGLLLTEMTSTIPENVSPEDSENAWARTRGILYDVESAPGCFSVKEMLGITSFVADLLEDRLPPPVAFDVHPENPIRESLWSAAALLNVQKTRLDRDAYIIRPDDQGFVVAMEDASLVVELLRRGIGYLQYETFDIRDIVRLFSSRGSPFRTLRPVHQPRARLMPPSLDLGFRSLDDPPSAFEYAQYEKLLEAFLLQPRARATLGLGGPIWRIVIEYLSSAHAEAGPSEQATVYGQRFSLPDGSSLWEDSLTESELLFLCGTYKVRKGPDVMLYSWWPSPKQWEGATPNVRYWSPTNERWFMARLTDIHNGRASWIKLADWPMKLRNNRKTKRLMNKNRSLCEVFLEPGIEHKQ